MPKPATGLVADLIGQAPTPHARMVVVGVLAKYGGTSQYIPRQSVKDRRREQAAHMLANGMSGAEVVRALRERFQIAERTAWRDIEFHRQMSGGNGIA